MNFSEFRTGSLRAGVVAGLALLLAGCGGGGPPPEPPPIQVAMQPAVEAAVDDVLPAVGTIEANEMVELKAESPGLIAKIAFEEGREVRAGDLLFELEAGMEQAQLAQARAEEEVAKQNLDRAQKLAGTRAISQQELDQLASQVAARAAARQMAEERLKDMTIVAPLNGVLGPRRVSQGQYVNSGQTLVTLVDHARVKVSYRVPERHLARFQLEQPVRIQVAAYPGQAFPGVVDLINPVIDEATRTAQVRARAENPDRKLKPGMFARVETVVDRRERAVVIPEQALVPSLEGFAVYRVQTNHASLVPVKLGVREPGRVEIAEGLRAGELVVIAGTQKLRDGAQVFTAPAKDTNATPATASP